MLITSTSTTENSVLPIETAAPSTNETIRWVYFPTSR